MGKRKSARKPVAKRKHVLETTFSCPFCNHAKATTTKLNKEVKMGIIQCRICSASYQTKINSLSEPIDVYHDWIDACEKANPPKNDDVIEEEGYSEEEEIHRVEVDKRRRVINSDEDSD